MCRVEGPFARILNGAPCASPSPLWIPAFAGMTEGSPPGSLPAWNDAGAFGGRVPFACAKGMAGRCPSGSLVIVGVRNTLRIRALQRQRSS